MTGLDFTFLGILLASVAIGAYRGLLRELISVGTWILAFAVAFTLAPRLAPRLSGFWEDPALRLGVAAVVLFVATLLVGGVLSLVVRQLVQSSGLTTGDRALGAAFGALRSVVVVAVLVQAAGLTALPQQPAWQDALLLDHFRDAAVWLRDWLPEGSRQLLSYS